MRVRGVTYDTGFINNGISTKEVFDLKIIKRELQIIKNDLHCNAIRITGGDADRLELTAKLAAEVGLEVWYCPFTCDLTINELQDFLLDCAERAEKIRITGAEVVFLTGSEISLVTKGFFSDDKFDDRILLLKDLMKIRDKIPEVRIKVNAFLKETVQLIRAIFHGKISYASLPFEAIDWTYFDIISTDGAYRNATNASSLEKGMEALVSQGKPVAITEFGCGTYQGAAEEAGQDLWIVDWENGKPIKVNGKYIRDEMQQAKYMIELFEIFEAGKIDAAFLTSFAVYFCPHRDDPLYDLDMSSYGIVKVYENKFGETYPDMSWEPKDSFKLLAAYFKTKSLS